VKIPKKEFFFQNLALAQLPKLPEMRVDTLLVSRKLIAKYRG